MGQTKCNRSSGDFFREKEFMKDDKYYTDLPNGELLIEVFKVVVLFFWYRKTVLHL